MGGKRRSGSSVLLTVAAAVVFAALVFLGSYAYAKYATEYGVTAPVALFDVTSEITYKDGWGEAKAFGGDLGTMKPQSGEVIEFWLTVENGGDVPVCFVITLDGNYGYGFSFHDYSLYDVEEAEAEVTDAGIFSLEDDDTTLCVNYPVMPGCAVTVYLEVNILASDEESIDADVYSVLLDMKITYTQASEEA